MILFLVLIGVLALLAGTVLVYGMRRARPAAGDRGPDPGSSRERINVAIFRERLAELDAERDSGRIGTAQHAALLAELQRLLISDVDPVDHPAAVVTPAKTSRRLSLSLPTVLPWLLLLLVPALSLVIYGWTGFTPETRAWLQLSDRDIKVVAPSPSSSGQAPLAPTTNERRQALLDAARLTQSTLSRRPADAESWHRLGVAWIELDVPVLAVESLRMAHRLAPTQMDYTLTLARVELALNDGKLNDDIRALFDVVLTMEPHHQGVLMVYGMAAFDSGEYALAAAHWQTLLAQIDPESEGAKLLRQSIATASQRAKTGADVIAAGDGIPVQVVMAPAMAAAVAAAPAGAALFVVVRAADGPPMPIAAKKLPPVLPVQITLTDADQMVPGAPLSTRGPLEVRARLSLVGRPAPAAGDIESEIVRVVLPLAAPIKLTLAKKLP